MIPIKEKIAATKIAVVIATITDVNARSTKKRAVTKVIDPTSIPRTIAELTNAINSSMLFNGTVKMSLISP